MCMREYVIFTYLAKNIYIFLCNTKRKVLVCPETRKSAPLSYDEVVHTAFFIKSLFNLRVYNYRMF